MGFQFHSLASSPGSSFCTVNDIGILYLISKVRSLECNKKIVLQKKVEEWTEKNVYIQNIINILMLFPPNQTDWCPWWVASLTEVSYHSPVETQTWLCDLTVRGIWNYKLIFSVKPVCLKYWIEVNASRSFSFCAGVNEDLFICSYTIHWIGISCTDFLGCVKGLRYKV